MERADCTVAEGLGRWARSRAALAPAANDAAQREPAAIENVHDLGGHSGETWGFTCRQGSERADRVIRIAPAGGGEGAAADLLRQASLLRALNDVGAKVAAVRDVSADTDLFGSAFLVVDRLPGKPLIMGPDGNASSLAAADRQVASEAAAVELAHIHALDISRYLADWDVPRSPLDEIASWTRAFERAAEPAWTQAGERLAAALRARAPDRWTSGLCHGDFQTNNVLFVATAGGPVVSGIVDWEIAHIGATEHDLAWFLMMNDDQAWDPIELRGGVDLVAVTRRYEAAAGRSVERLDWFRALACYRFAAIAGYKIRLHRTGRKTDEAWERASSSMPRFFARAHALLGAE